MWYVIDGVGCLFLGGFLSYLYAGKVIQKYEKAAGEVGVFFKKIEGKVTASKRG